MNKLKEMENLKGSMHKRELGEIKVYSFSCGRHLRWESLFLASESFWGIVFLQEMDPK